MGFFSWLSGSKTQQLDSSQHKLYPWKAVESPTITRLPGEEEREAYVYDARPFRSSKKNVVIVLDLFPGRASLTSTASGTRTSTSDFGNSCLMYDGHPVGFISVPIDEVKRAHDFGFHLQVTARVGGNLAGYPGIRKLTVSVPHRFHAETLLIEQARKQFGVPESAGQLTYNEWDEADYAQLKSRKTWIFENATLSFEPVPQGSSAKPHLTLSDGSGKQISRVTARNSVYKQLVHIANSGDKLFVTAVRTSGTSPTIGYTISISHWQ